MEYVYAALLLHKEKKEINETNISNIIKASGVEVNEAQVKALVAALADVNIDDAIKAAPVAVAAAPAAGGGAKEEKKEAETPSGKSEEEAMQGLSALFG
ncbi:MAG: 50S ribosomal protein P1 [Thaumarchaeota archaeon]|nr:MAG: 50S ribosomal protein P1 [Nitrososphaerota archaeon]